MVVDEVEATAAIDDGAVAAPAAGLTGDDDVDHYLQKLDVQMVLEGRLPRVANILAYANKAAGAAVNDRLRTPAGQVLERRVQEIVAAQALQAKNIQTMTEDELKVHLAAVGSRVFPHVTCLALLRRHGLSLPPRELVSAMWPIRTASSLAVKNFDPFNPRLHALPGTDEQKAHAYAQCVLVDRLAFSMSQMDGDLKTPKCNEARDDMQALAEAHMQHQGLQPLVSLMLEAALTLTGEWLAAVAAVVSPMITDRSLALSKVFRAVHEVNQNRACPM